MCHIWNISHQKKSSRPPGGPWHPLWETLGRIGFAGRDIFDRQHSSGYMVYVLLTLTSTTETFAGLDLHNSCIL
jgi:hypothetical protein